MPVGTRDEDLPPVAKLCSKHDNIGKGSAGDPGAKAVEYKTGRRLDRAQAGSPKMPPTGRQVRNAHGGERRAADESRQQPRLDPLVAHLRRFAGRRRCAA